MVGWRHILSWEVEVSKPSWPPNEDWVGWIVEDISEQVPAGRYGIVKRVNHERDGTYSLEGYWGSRRDPFFLRYYAATSPTNDPKRFRLISKEPTTL